jgi:uncharacterized protein
MRLTAVDWIALILVIVGALNWGLVGLFEFDLVAALFGTLSVMSKIVYTLVGFAGLWTIYLVTRLREHRDL